MNSHPETTAVTSSRRHCRRTKDLVYANLELSDGPSEVLLDRAAKLLDSRHGWAEVGATGHLGDAVKTGAGLNAVGQSSYCYPASAR